MKRSRLRRERFNKRLSFSAQPKSNGPTESDAVWLWQLEPELRMREPVVELVNDGRGERTSAKGKLMIVTSGK